MSLNLKTALFIAATQVGCEGYGKGSSADSATTPYKDSGDDGVPDLEPEVALEALCEGTAFTDLELQTAATHLAVDATLCLSGEIDCEATQANGREVIDAIFEGILTAEGLTRSDFEAGTASATLGVSLGAYPDYFLVYLAWGGAENEDDWEYWLGNRNEAGALISSHPTDAPNVYAITELGMDAELHNLINSAYDGDESRDPALRVSDWRNLEGLEGHDPDEVYLVDADYSREKWVADSAYDTAQVEALRIVCAARSATQDMEFDGSGDKNVVVSF